MHARRMVQEGKQELSLVTERQHPLEVTLEGKIGRDWPEDKQIHEGLMRTWSKFA